MLVFGEFTLDRESYSLRLKGEEVPIQRRTLDLLLYLIERSGQTVSKEELLEKVWFDAKVTDSALGQALYQLRRALGQSSESIVETVRGRGVRFCAVLQEESALQIAAAESQFKRSGLSSLLGRDGEIQTLLAAAQGALQGETSLLTIWGEPGIGKSTLLRLGHAGLANLKMTVLTGAAREDGLVSPFSLFTELASFLLKDEAVLGRLPAKTLGRIRRLFPQFMQYAAVGAPTEFGREAQLRAYAALGEAMGVAASVRPLAILLDDVHRADSGSLELLRFLVEGGASAPVLFVCALRDTEEILAEEGGSEVFSSLRARYRINLSGFPAGVIRLFIVERTGRELSEELLARLVKVTGGSPFLLQEAARVIALDGSSTTLEGLVGQSDRGLVAARSALSRLSPEARRALAEVSVLGRTLSEVHAVALGSSEAELRAALNEARQAGLVDALAAGNYRFSHVLTQNALYEELSATERCRLHRRASGLFDRGASSGLAEASEASHHALLGVDDDASARAALVLSQRAAELQSSALGLDAAIGTLRAALSVGRRLDASVPEWSLEVRFQLVEALSASAAHGEALDQAYQLAELALSLGKVSEAARAIVIYGGLQKSFGDRRLIGFLQRLVTEHQGALGASLPAVLVELGWSLRHTPFFKQGREASQAALQMAQGMGDELLLSRAILGLRWNAVGDEAPQAQLAMSREALAHSALAGTPYMELESSMWLLSDALEVGDAGAYQEALDILLAMPSRVSHAWFDVIAQRYAVVDLLARGELAQAQARVEAVRAQGRLVGDSVTEICWLLESYYPSAERGSLVEHAEMAAHINAEMGGRSTWQCFQAACLARMGELESAQALLRDFMATMSLEALGFSYTTALALGAEVVVRAGDRAMAQELGERLLDHPAERFSIAAGALYLGPKSYYQGLCCQVLGDLEQAGRFYEAAAQDARGFGHLYFLARSLLSLGEVRPAEEGQASIREAFELGKRLGAERLVEVSGALLVAEAV